VPAVGSRMPWSAASSRRAALSGRPVGGGRRLKNPVWPPAAGADAELAAGLGASITTLPGAVPFVIANRRSASDPVAGSCAQAVEASSKDTTEDRTRLGLGRQKAGCGGSMGCIIAQSPLGETACAAGACRSLAAAAAQG
jgi:hypothetical protein